MSTIRCVRCQKEVDSTYKACPYCGEAITDFLRRYMVEPIDGKYEIVERLGAGGMGEVYKVRHKFLNALRVIKVIRPQILDSGDAHERFLREARAATRVQHPNVATLHDFSELPDGSHYMVWEYIDGENLAQRVRRRGVLPPSDAVRITIEALHGLDAIHRAGIVHRDISPENIMITRDDNRVKIIDLGVAKVAEEVDQQATRTGIFLGKLRYASPEHLGFLPEGEKIDGRADLYSIGIVLYEIMTGRPPFEATSPHEYLMHHSAETPMAQIKMDAIPGGPGLQSVVMRALERDRNKRFNNAREFAGALEEIQKTLAPANDAETVMGAALGSDATMRMTPAPVPVPVQTTPRPDTLHRTTVRTDAGAPPPAAPPPVVLPPGVSTQPGSDYNFQPPPPQTPYPPPPQQTPYPQQQQYQPYAAAQTAKKKSSILPWILAVFVILLLTAGGAAWYIKKNLMEEPTRSSTQVAQSTTSPATQSASMANVNVTVPSTTSASATTETTASTTPVIKPEPQTNTVAPAPQPVIPAPQPQPLTRRQQRRLEADAQPAPQPQPRTATTEESDASDEEPVNKYLQARPFVEGGDSRSNDYAVAEARRALTGISHLAITGGADPMLQTELASLLRRNGVQVLPSSDIVVHFDGAVERLNRGRKQRSARATITRKGRVVFRYEMAPEEYRVGDDPAEALARVLSNVFGR